METAKMAVPKAKMPGPDDDTTKATPAINAAKNKILRLAASIEKNSEHPLASAIIQEAKQKKIKLITVKNFKALPGKGVKAWYQNHQFFLGTRRLLKENSIKIPYPQHVIRFYKKKGVQNNPIEIKFDQQR